MSVHKILHLEGIKGPGTPRKRSTTVAKKRKAAKKTTKKRTYHRKRGGVRGIGKDFSLMECFNDAIDGALVVGGMYATSKVVQMVTEGLDGVGADASLISPLQANQLTQQVSTLPDSSLKSNLLSALSKVKTGSGGFTSSENKAWKYYLASAGIDFLGGMLGVKNENWFHKVKLGSYTLSAASLANQLLGGGTVDIGKGVGKVGQGNIAMMYDPNTNSFIPVETQQTYQMPRLRGVDEEVQDFINSVGRMAEGGGFEEVKGTGNGGGFEEVKGAGSGLAEAWSMV